MSKTDHFAKFAGTTPEQGGDDKGHAHYQAFDAKDRTKCLQIRPAQGHFNTPSYVYLLTVITDRNLNTAIDLIFSFMVVRIKGRNLQPVIDALHSRNCVFIQEFNEAEFTRPEPDEPCIDSIVIAMHGGEAKPEG